MRFSIEVDDADVIRALEKLHALEPSETARPAALPPHAAGRVFVSRAEAVAMGVELRVLLRAVKSGALRAYKPGRVITFRRADVIALVESHPFTPPAPPSAPAGGAEVVELDPFERARQRRLRAR